MEATERTHLASSPRAWRGWARRPRSPCSPGRARWSATGRDIIHLEIGEPDFDTPAHITEAGIAALRAGETHYCPAAGIAELREAAAAELSRTRGVPIAPERVLVANGAKPFLFFTILATCEPGDEVVYPDPGFPIYESAIRWVGATPVPLPLREELGFSFALEDLQARLSARTKLVILNSPQNPTGGVTPARRPRCGRGPDPRDARPGCSPTRSTRDSSTATRSPRSPACPGCSSAPSCSTASRRPTR